MAPKRQRRTAEEARRLILDATEKRVAQVGPAGIRLQDVAADVGVSHPAILHHFGSREGLIDAVIERAVRHLEQDLINAFGKNVDATQATELLDHVFDTLGDRGHAQLLAWLILSTRHTPQQEQMGKEHTLAKIADAIHALRKDARGEQAPAAEDTVFAVMLAALALFGEGLAGEVMCRSAGLEDAQQAQQRFRKWLARLLVRHLEGKGV